MSSRESVTELEGATLALIARETAVTAYQIKEWFRRSPSSFWSGSAGAVYPLMKRLETAGLVESKDESLSKRPKKVFRLTAAGQFALTAWLLDADRAADMGYDPVRTRLAFISQVPKQAARSMLSAVLERQDEFLPPSEAPGTIQAHDSWLAMRRRWIKGWLKNLA
ncbi:PadR family transcriptional regulator [Hyphobacterium sp.]|uniref:PadR family transcriptional regulator n=1 Tax=Hyphobacterium sp. TaxID=2004662 RepID=UPI003BAD609B